MLAPAEATRDAKRQLYRDLIVGAAERLFAKEGFEQVRVQTIAAAAGVSLTTLYASFKGKRQIWDAIHERRLSELMEVAQGALSANAAASPIEQLLAGTEVYFRFFFERPDFLKIQLRGGLAWSREEAIAAGTPLQVWRLGVEMMEQLVKAGMEAGELRTDDPAHVARLLIATQQVWFARWVDGDESESVEALIEEVAAFVERAFGSAQR